MTTTANPTRTDAAELGARVTGPVFLPGDDGYAAECATYNLNAPLEPALAVGVTSVADVQAAVRFAARREMPVAIKSTGHQVDRSAHGAVLISTRRMDEVAIDADGRTARIGPGARWRQVIAAAAESGLAPMNSSALDVGAVGYSIGGGLSPAWGRSKGYAADHIRCLEVVTADGQLRHAGPDTEPELFWALRGGKGNRCRAPRSCTCASPTWGRRTKASGSLRLCARSAPRSIFVGLYWQHYGQIGAGMEVSGLEDEFDLSDGMPRLLYVKVPAPEREPRLADLLSRVRQEASYRRFRTAAELGRLVRDDLATLLSERFDVSRPRDAEAPRESPAARGPEPLPVATTSLVGREQAIEEVAGLIRSPDARLVTLTGPGGIGKTRLALAVGERTADRFPAGVAFVPLESVTSPEALLGAIGREVGAEMAGAASPLQALVDHFGDGRWLLILDNLEQVVEAARDLNELLARCAGVTILATCLMALRLRAESEYAVPPLALPPDPATADPDALASSPPVQLFVDRASAVRHDFALTPANAAAVAEIARRLEGLPLAIELAAARSRLLDPDALLQRLMTSFDALGTGAVDVPERQRTLRATVEWSMGLLDDDERSLLETMAVFVDGFTVEAAAEVAGLDEDRTLYLTEALAGHSLIVIQHPEPGLRSRMLDTIRAFVCERLAARPDLAEIQRRHADHYRTLAERADRPLRGFGESVAWVERLQAEAGNLAAAVRWYLEHDRAPLPHLFRVLSPFRVLWPWWGLRNEVMGEARGWVAELLPAADALEPQARAELLWTATVTALEVSDDAAAVAGGERLGPLVEQIDDPYLVAVSHLVLAWTAALGPDIERVKRELTLSVEELRAQDEPLWLAIALVTLGATDAYVGRYDEAQGHLSEVRAIAERFDNARLGAIVRAQLGRLAITRGRLEDAGALLAEGVDLSLRTGSTHALTMVLAACAQLALAEGDAERAALIAGAAEGLRVRAGLRVWMSVSEPSEAIAPIREAVGPDRFDEVFAAGAQLSQDEAVEAARAASAVSAPAGAGPPAPA